MPAPIIPWQPSNIPTELQEELNRRRVNRSFKYIPNNTNAGTWDANGDWNQYRGPMVSWIRLCSNSAGHPLVKKERLILHSGKGFYQSYGFQPPSNPSGVKKQIIAYTPGNFVPVGPPVPPEPHTIDNDLIGPEDKKGDPENFPIHVPPPEISRLEVTVQKELFRRAQVEWVCFSWKQLAYLTPYLLIPGITCMCEWGWNHFNLESLVNLADTAKMQEHWDNAYPLYINHIIKSKGNYDVIYGIVTNFNWSVEGNKIVCMTEITSKDRLYAGLAKDYGMSVAGDKDDKSLNSGGIFQSLKDFLGKDDTAKSLRTIVTTGDPLKEGADLSKATPQDMKWLEILKPLLLKPANNPDVQIMRRPWVFGLFSGRPDDSYTENEKFGKPRSSDFDKGIKANDPVNIWINMGMVVEILNHFSAADSGAKKGKNMFYVDIQNSVIGAHPNMISCNRQVLIPNSKAPKYHFGSEGWKDSGTYEDAFTDYGKQMLNPQNITSGSIQYNADMAVRKTFYHIVGGNPGMGMYVFRDDISRVINYNRYRFVNLQGGGETFYNSWSFPSSFTKMTPASISGLAPNEVEADYSGLLSNIYLNFAAFKDAVDNSANESYVDIYKNILTTLMGAVDGFWDLSLVDVDGTLTIVDRNYVGKYGFRDNEKVFTFDYYDADSLIKSLKFRPFLSDAQATRVIYGSVNNQDAKFKYYDKNDVLDYKFRDAVIGREEDKKQGGNSSLLQRIQAANKEHRDLVRSVQKINGKSDDGSLQMTLYPDKTKIIKKNDGSTKEVKAPTIVKLCLNGTSGQQLLRLMLNDDDYVSNARYCAVQPNIVMEMTIQGIGGLRTFQYFLVKNLPEPYSSRNIIFRITDVIQTLEAGNWETTIRAQFLPLRAYIKKRVKGPLTNQPNDGNGWPIEETFPSASDKPTNDRR